LFCLFIGYTFFLIRKYSFLSDYKETIIKANTEFNEKYESNSYFSKKELNNWLEKYNNLKKTIKEYVYQIERLESYREKTIFLKTIIEDYINVFLLPREYKRVIEHLYNVFNKGFDIVNKRNQAYIQKETDKWSPIFINLPIPHLNSQQLSTIITNEVNNLVIVSEEEASIPLIIGKTHYLLEKEHILPNDILILTSSDESKTEIENFTKLFKEIQIYTHLDLGSEIIKQVSGVSAPLHEVTHDPYLLQETMKDFIKSHISDLDFANKINLYFLYSNNSLKKNFKTVLKHEQFLENLDIKTINGDKVNNVAVLSIANFFYLNNIKYMYKQAYPYQTSNLKKYTPDFYLPDYNIWIEHIEIDKNCNPSSSLDRDEYLDHWYWKRKIHKENYTDLIETYDYEFKDRTIIGSLKTRLLVRGVHFKPNPKEKIFNKLKDLGDINRFINQIIQFQKKVKSNTVALDEIINNARNPPVNRKKLTFLELLEILSRDYEAMLRDSESFDLEDIINMAIPHIEQNKIGISFKYLLLDEFQEINNNQYKFIKSLLEKNPNSKTFCIGYKPNNSGIIRDSPPFIFSFRKHFYPGEVMFLNDTNNTK
jgi:DNA helicase-4